MAVGVVSSRQRYRMPAMLPRLTLAAGKMYGSSAEPPSSHLPIYALYGYISVVGAPLWEKFLYSDISPNKIVLYSCPLLIITLISVLDLYSKAFLFQVKCRSMDAHFFVILLIHLRGCFSGGKEPFSRSRAPKVRCWLLA